jgi:hypothetical protein
VRIAVLFTLVLALIGATPPVGGAPLDSQLALERYELEMSTLKPPKAVIFTYTVSQAGALAIEQRHRIYRSGQDVRDETLAVDGTPLVQKVVRISQRPDRYDITRIAPRTSGYTMLFLHAQPQGSRLDYVYEVKPLVTPASGFVVTRLTIDGDTFLPRSVAFTASSGDTQGTGELQYGKSGKYWVPLVASVTADVKGKPTRERITWSDYRFPESLPRSTFAKPKPLPQATLPPE